MVVLAIVTMLGFVGLTVVVSDPAGAASYSLSVTVQNPDPRVGDDLVLDISTNLPSPDYAVQWKNETLATNTSKAGVVTLRVPLDAVPLGSQTISISATNVNDDLLVVTRPFTKQKLTPTLELVDTDIEWWRPIEVRVSAPASSVIPTGGSVTATTAAGSQTVPLSNDGVARFSSRALLPGTYEIQASYNGDSAWNPSEYKAIGSVTIAAAVTETSVTVTPGTVTAGSPVSAAYSVTTKPGVLVGYEHPLTLTARKAGSTAVETIAALNAGPNEAPYDLTAFAATHPGTWYLRGTTAAHGGYAASQSAEIPLTVIAGSVETTTTVAFDPVAASAPVHGTAIKAVVSVKGDDGSTPAGDVTVSVDGRALPAESLETGVANVDLPATAVGTHRVVASYSGGGVHRTSISLERTYEMTKAATSISVPMPQEVDAGAAVPFTVFAKDSRATPSGEIRISEGGTQLGVVPVVAGSQQGSGIGAVTVGATWAPGTHVLTLTYTGNTEALESTTQMTVVVKGTTGPPVKQPTTTSVTLDRDSTTVGGAAVTATATVSVEGGAAPNGQFSVVVDGVVVATRQAGAAPMAFPLPVEKAGTHSVVLRYSGSAGQAASESATRAYVVTAATTTPVPAVASAVKAAFKKIIKGKKRILKVTTTVTSSTAVTGRVQLTETIKVRKPGKHGKPGKLRTKRKVLGTATISKAGTTKKVIIRAKGLKKGKHTFTVRYLGSPTVLSSTKVYKVRVR